MLKAHLIFSTPLTISLFDWATGRPYLQTEYYDVMTVISPPEFG
ncbi:uncharacterized protein LOC116888505 isoform X2 [Rattus rattus]|nr:uncharacterized protein LOC116888505 isoform X2 [Rattus rattus]